MIDLDKLRAVIAYDPDTGHLTWTRNAPAKVAGRQAGCLTNCGYRYVQVNKVGYYAHRLAFILMTGREPPEMVDHINLNRDDNRWSNLRLCSGSENQQNIQKARLSNKSSGVLGVYWSKTKKKWRSQIRIDGRIRHLGYFDSIDESHIAYVNAKREHHKFGVL
ncbi:HNH endonuclease [Comamonas sp. B21-038]|uniref:HNH endonuclease n=1 Tax=Comamonas sp. B21-038 TaxID=2918299 RepID=UPI001EFA3E29|nr:HNH endonuclease [Comamonas sp. B21-038]ULR87412.1 HNH endonuclease [Comamonas sp. B21-038]